MTSAVRSAAADWFDDNDEGLRLAEGGAWEDALQAFESAVRRLTAGGPGEPEGHEALALALGNLANACYRVGRLDDAIAHAQRACALREALAGEDALTVARMRSDLAVMLVAAGRADEAPALLDRAIAGIDRSVGDDDPRLATVLENAARAALLLGQPSNAEPILLRLHALLDAHGAETVVAEGLLAEVATSRSASIAGPPAENVPAVPLAPPVDTPPVEAVTSKEPLADTADWGREPERDEDEHEDQPLLDAVRVTDALLRTTPTGVPAIREEVVGSAPPAEPPVEPEPDATPVTPTSTAPSAFDGIDDELELVPLREPDITPPSMPASGSAPPVSASALGFEVQYGVLLDSDLMQPPAASAPETPSSNDAQPVAGAAPMTDPMGDLELIDVSSTPAPALEPLDEERRRAAATPERLEPESAATSAGLASPSEPRRPAVVLPTADGGHSMARPTTNAEDRELAALRSRLSETPEGGATRRAPRVAGGEPRSKGRGAAIGAVVGLAAAAAAGWFLFRGGYF